MFPPMPPPANTKYQCRKCQSGAVRVQWDMIADEPGVSLMCPSCGWVGEYFKPGDPRASRPEPNGPTLPMINPQVKPQ